jgi:hypothetical protein
MTEMDVGSGRHMPIRVGRGSRLRVTLRRGYAHDHAHLELRGAITLAKAARRAAPMGCNRYSVIR